MRTTTLFAVLTFLLTNMPAGADDPLQKEPRKVGLPVKLQVVMTRSHGEAKVARLVYTLSTTADDIVAVLHTGIQVPVRYESKETSGNVVYKSVGTNLRCEIGAVENGRFKISCDVGLESVFGEDGGQNLPAASAGSSLPPVLREFSSKGVLLLRDGETAQYSLATDPLNGDILKTDMTLTVVK